MIKRGVHWVPVNMPRASAEWLGLPLCYWQVVLMAAYEPSSRPPLSRLPPNKARAVQRRGVGHEGSKGWQHVKRTFCIVGKRRLLTLR